MSKTVELLKQLQADAQVLFVKFHNYHWNVEGMDFFPVHNQTEEMYNSMATLFDDAAERVIQLGGTPYITLAQVLSASKIKEEENNSFRSKYIVEAIVKDYEYLLDLFKQIDESADSKGDTTTSAFAQDNIANLEKTLWMLGAMLR
ncbi:MAG: DNA starvation/stationary phase protection protein [Arcobacteraceae bacterium]|nr:DNA starvation/stationary phase protection protein [Arcobacteraceae bacterium]MDY0365643.1 DNA starvation/stationary phase protection protein [Arcobacteraceae bacterium]